MQATFPVVWLIYRMLCGRHTWEVAWNKVNSMSTCSSLTLMSVAYQPSMNSVKYLTARGHRSDQHLILMETGSVFSVYVCVLLLEFEQTCRVFSSYSNIAYWRPHYKSYSRLFICIQYPKDLSYLRDLAVSLNLCMPVHVQELLDLVLLDFWALPFVFYFEKNTAFQK